MVDIDPVVMNACSKFLPKVMVGTLNVRFITMSRFLDA